VVDDFVVVQSSAELPFPRVFRHTGRNVRGRIVFKSGGQLQANRTIVFHPPPTFPTVSVEICVEPQKCARRATQTFDSRLGNYYNCYNKEAVETSFDSRFVDNFGGID
jgi:hypothetical protein